jgi:predicted small lipoprotein YifL
MKKLLFLFLSTLILITGCGNYGKLKLPPKEKQEDKQIK